MIFLKTKQPFWGHLNFKHSELTFTCTWLEDSNCCHLIFWFSILGKNMHICVLWLLMFPRWHNSFSGNIEHCSVWHDMFCKCDIVGCNFFTHKCFYESHSVDFQFLCNNFPDIKFCMYSTIKLWYAIWAYNHFLLISSPWLSFCSLFFIIISLFFITACTLYSMVNLEVCKYSECYSVASVEECLCYYV